MSSRQITETGKGVKHIIKAEDPNGNKFTFKVEKDNFDEYQIGKIIDREIAAFAAKQRR